MAITYIAIAQLLIQLIWEVQIRVCVQELRVGMQQ